MSLKYCDYLLEELNKTKSELHFDDVKIIVAPERSFKMPKEENVLLFIVKQLTGKYTLNTKTQPFQIIVYSELNTFHIAQQILELFVFNHKNGSPDSTFTENGVLIKQDYDTPVALRQFIASETSFKASFYCFGNYVECENLQDIKNVKYNKYGAITDINYITASIAYGAVLNTTKASGEEISTSMKQEAGMTIQMTLMNDSSDFVKDINKVMLGVLSGNTPFRIAFTLNDVNYSENFILTDASFNTDRVNAPGLNVVFTR
jgi:hypothetical protein